MASVSYSPTERHVAGRCNNAGIDVQGPLPCDKIQKGDLIRLAGNERKVRVVRYDKHTGYTQCVWVVKLRRSGYPAPHTHLNRHRLKDVTIAQRGVDLYSTELESRLQMALDRYVRALADPDDDFEVRSVVTESDVVGILQ